ncbi:MAG: FAD-dependent oxidoreductase [Candidatus Roizmanbacteria bacterium]
MLLTYKTVLTKKKLLVGNIFLFTFKLIDPPEINFIPGQYLILKVNEKSRLYSIASPNTIKNRLEFIIEIIPKGMASNYLMNLKENDEVSFQGPAGQFTLRENNKQKIFLVTGTGIAPVRSMLKNFQFPIFNFQLFWGLKTYKDVYFLDELKEFNLKICLSREQNFDMIPELDRKYFDLGHVDKCIEKLFINGLTDCEYYLCGRREVVDSLKNFLIFKNIPQENIIFEKF